MVLKLGLIGCGVMGKNVLRFAKNLTNAQITAVADIDAACAGNVAAEFGIPKNYSNPLALISDKEINAVILELPTYCRTELALAAFMKGKHVLTEKPAAMNAGEVKKMLAVQNDLIGACCSSRLQFLPSAKVVSDTISKNVIGEIRLIRCKGLFPPGEKPLNPPAWRFSKSLNGGGLLMNWGCYDLDYILGILNWTVRPIAAFAQMWPCMESFRDYVHEQSNAETHYVATLLCPNDLTIIMERGELVCSVQEHYYEIVGTNGTIKVNVSPEKDKKVLFFDAACGQGKVSEVLWEGEESWDICHFGVLEDFVDAVCCKRQPRTNLKRALDIQRTIDALYESNAKKQFIDIF